MPNLRNGSKGDSNPGSLDCESGILPLSYHAPVCVCNVCGGIFRSAIGMYSHKCTHHYATGLLTLTDTKLRSQEEGLKCSQPSPLLHYYIPLCRDTILTFRTTKARSILLFPFFVFFATRFAIMISRADFLFT